jgi:putative endonuclease
VSALDGQYFIYILANARHTVLYTVFANNLRWRVYERRQKLVSGFTSRYNVDKLVFYETFSGINAAIAREAGSR